MTFNFSLASASVLAEVIGNSLLSWLLLYTSLDLGRQSHNLQSRGSTILSHSIQLYRSLFFKPWN